MTAKIRLYLRSKEKLQRKNITEIKAREKEAHMERKEKIKLDSFLTWIQGKTLSDQKELLLN